MCPHCFLNKNSLRWSHLTVVVAATCIASRAHATRNCRVTGVYTHPDLCLIHDSTQSPGDAFNLQEAQMWSEWTQCSPDRIEHSVRCDTFARQMWATVSGCTQCSRYLCGQCGKNAHNAVYGLWYTFGSSRSYTHNHTCTHVHIVGHTAA